MYCHRIAAFDKNGLVAVTGQKTTDPIIAFATPDSWMAIELSSHVYERLVMGKRLANSMIGFLPTC
jgi:hypothetical protein